MHDLSVVIVDDHTLFRSGLSELLDSRNVNVIGMTGRSSEAVSLVDEKRPDIVLLDLRMPEPGGLQVLEHIRELLPEQCVVILTTSAEESDLLKALKLGAAGYLLKDMDPDNFAQLLRQAFEGETVVAPNLTGLLARVALSGRSSKKDASANSYNLTPREMDILRHIGRGQSNKEIASALGIVEGTVKLHVRAVLKKLGVQSRVQAAVLAVSENLCEESG